MHLHRVKVALFHLSYAPKTRPAPRGLQRGREHRSRAKLLPRGNGTAWWTGKDSNLRRQRVRLLSWPLDDRSELVAGVEVASTWIRLMRPARSLRSPPRNRTELVAPGGFEPPSPP